MSETGHTCICYVGRTHSPGLFPKFTDSFWAWSATTLLPSRLPYGPILADCACDLLDLPGMLICSMLLRTTCLQVCYYHIKSEVTNSTFNLKSWHFSFETPNASISPVASRSRYSYQVVSCVGKSDLFRPCVSLPRYIFLIEAISWSAKKRPSIFLARVVGLAPIGAWYCPRLIPSFEIFGESEPPKAPAPPYKNTWSLFGRSRDRLMEGARHRIRCD
jgi:hypothetical protein